MCNYTCGVAQAADCPEVALVKANAVVRTGNNNPYSYYCYDQNGNPSASSGQALRRRQVGSSTTASYSYDAENRLTSISGSGISATYVYDGDGQRVKTTVGSGAMQTNTVYIGNYYERDNGTTVRKYYYAGGVRVAMRSGSQTYYLLGDHLTSTAITLDSAGNRLNSNTELRYYPYGAARYDTLNQQTIHRYTGQRIETSTGLYDYGARWYDPAIGRFLAADTVVPNPGDPQTLNRYAYVLNNPVRYRDPSGHSACMDCYGGGIGPEVVAAAGASLLTQAGQALNVTVADAQAFSQSLGQQLGNMIPAIADQFANPGQASSAASSNAGNTAGPGGLDPNDPWRWGANYRANYENLSLECSVLD